MELKMEPCVGVSQVLIANMNSSIVEISRRHGRARLFLAVMLTLSFVCLATGLAIATESVTPTSITFPTVTVGLSAGNVIYITNTGTTPITVTNVVVTPFPTFYMSDGVFPAEAIPNQTLNFSVRFLPTAAGSYTGQFQFFFSDGTNFTVSLSGAAVTTTAVSTLGPQSLTFANQALGATSSSQTVSITNTGAAPFVVEAVRTFPPFSVSGFTRFVNVNPGKSFNVQVNYFGTPAGSATGTLTIYYNVLPPNGVTLSGTTTSSGALAPTIFPTLPASTYDAAYSATLTAEGGTPPYSWALATGSNLPSDLLTLATDGVISGSIDTNVADGTYSFTTQVTDSSTPPNLINQANTMSVAAPTGANCSDISFNDPIAGTPLVPVTDLGMNYYEGVQGGLYPGGTNVRPSAQDQYGVNLANSIQPLDTNGNPSPTGKYVLVSIGQSDNEISFSQFVTNAMADPSTNPNLVVVDGGQSRAAAELLSNSNNGHWNEIVNSLLPAAGVSANQVVAVWLMTIDSPPSGTFSASTAHLQGELETIAQILLQKFPNLLLTYVSSRYYAGYSNGIRATDPEPYSYEQAFAVKNMIADQLNGDPSLNYNPSLGPVVAPWLSWGPYTWANGLIPRSDDLVWTCQDLRSDGIHPVLAGSEKESNLLMNFFRTDDTTAPWFLAPGASAPVKSGGRRAGRVIQ
jgi:hypothetical protein